MASAEKFEPTNQKNNSAFLTKAPSLLIFFAALYLLVDYLSYYGPAFIPIILGVVAVFLLFIDQKKFVYFITILTLLSDDVSKYLQTIEGSLAKSIVGYPLGENTILAYILILALAKLILDALIRKKVRFSLNIYDQILIVISLLYIFTAIIGLPNLLTYPRQYMTQASPIIIIIVSYLLIRKNFCSKDELMKFFKIIVIAFTARLLVTAGMFFILGPDKGHKISYASISQLILIPLYFWLSLLIWKCQRKKTSILQTCGIVILIIFILFNLYISGVRYLILSFIVSLLLVFLFLALSLPKLAKIGAFLGITLIGLFILESIFIPRDFELYKWKYINLLDWSLQPPESGTTTIAAREIEFINIFGKLVNKNSLFWGEGLGSYFDTKYYPLPNIIYERKGESAYPLEWLEKDQFFRPHHPLIQIFLQIGLLGLLIYLFLLFLIFYNMFRCFHKCRSDAELKILFFSLFLGAFPILTSNWSLVTNYLFGLILGLVSLGYTFSNQSHFSNLVAKDALNILHNSEC